MNLIKAACIFIFFHTHKIAFSEEYLSKQGNTAVRVILRMTRTNKQTKKQTTSSRVDYFDRGLWDGRQRAQRGAARPPQEAVTTNECAPGPDDSVALGGACHSPLARQTGAHIPLTCPARPQTGNIFSEKRINNRRE